MWHDIEQNTDMWLDMRIGKIGGSTIGKIMVSSRELVILKAGKDGFKIANTGTKTILAKQYETKIDAEKALSIMYAKNPEKSFTDTAKKIAVVIARELVTGKRSIAESYSNAHMDRGHEQEPIARALYEDTTFCDVTNGGFYDNGFTSCSPDGHIINGLIEIKSVIDTTHFATIQRGSYDPSYRWQLFHNLRESGKEKIDFVSYCADFPENNQLFIFTILASESQEQFKQLKSRISDFEELVHEYKKVIE
ncbi:MAG: YqaJ viral recombinase family protein [Candidatus Anammoxibacter sp.]